MAPDIPSLEAQERRDRVGWGAYRRLALSGALRVAEGLRGKTPPGDLVRAVHGVRGRPEVIFSDRFRLGELQDCVNGTPLVPWVARWSESTADIRALRRYAKDEPLAVAPESRGLLTASFSATMVANDDAGNVCLKKRGTNNCARGRGVLAGAAAATTSTLGAGRVSRRAPHP